MEDKINISGDNATDIKDVAVGDEVELIVPVVIDSIDSDTGAISATIKGPVTINETEGENEKGELANEQPEELPGPIKKAINME
jgi:hypothetical protein